ncbi:phage major capsid protein [Aeromicrobium fastidiosum]|uniref:Phage major capsid protein n=1 Tax=Aeromicrobium fastidiosum TaxID=52699 RepID=A0A641AJY7_9ACTN|nr:phage major capsid protein [Aeromicrobium fastidiosum]KAA1376125.1 phage major capsid protein [Aeromicrobium fastidiosum]MBP2391995.1 HK97 family phage major capsid protein [Aeromicrobium fastidiosum]
MAINTGNATELLQTQVAKVLTKPLEAQSVFLASGPVIYDTAGPLRLPSLGGPITDPGWTGEGETIPTRDVDFGDVSLLPSTMKSVKVITKMSEEIVRQAVVSLETAVRQRLVTDVASKIDTQFFGASGDGVETPRGLFSWLGTQTVAAAGGLTYDVLLAAWSKALSANVNMGSLKFVVTPREFVTLKGLKDGDGRYLAQPDPTLDSVYRAFGIPIVVTPRIPDTTGGTPTGRAALVDFSQVAVARDLAPSVKILNELYAGTGEVGIRVQARYDVAPVNPSAVVKITGITIPAA